MPAGEVLVLGGRAGPPDPPQRWGCYGKSLHHQARVKGTVCSACFHGW
jgi:hypothetical protein